MIVLIGLAAVLIGLARWYINGVYNFWKKKGVPNPAPTLFLGNIAATILMKKHLGIIYEEMYNKYKDFSYIGFYKILTPSVLLRDIDLVKEVLVKEFASFHDNDIDMDVTMDPLFGKHPFVLKGNTWKVVRSQITSAITSAKVKQMFTFMANISKDLVNYLNNEVEITGKDGIEAKELSTKFTADVVAACAFGLEGRSFIDPDAEFRRMGRKIFETSPIESTKLILIFMFPKLSKFFKIGVLRREIKEWFMGTLQQTIKYREENNIVRHDYLDLMLSLKSKPSEYVFTDMDVMAQSMTFYSDGMDTSATTLSFTLYEIAKNPDVQEKLRKEVDSVLAKYMGDIVYEAVQEMEYLDMVISEALRMYPPGMFLMKSCTKQFTFPPPTGEGTGPGVVLDPGMSVIIPVYAIHYDPKYYPDPEKFDPERFTEEAKKDRPKCAYMPFGEGPRMCLGYRFALAQIKAALAATVANFELKVNPKTDKKMEVDPLSFLIGKKGGLWLNFYKRSK